MSRDWAVRPRGSGLLACVLCALALSLGPGVGVVRGSQYDNSVLYAASWLGPGWGPCGIVRVDKATGAQTLVTAHPLLADLFVIIQETPTTLLAVTPGWGNNGRLMRIDTTTGAVSVIASGLGQASGLCIGPGGDIFVANDGWGGPGSIFRINPNTGAVTTFSYGGRPSKIIYHSDGFLYFTGWDVGGGRIGIARLDPNTGAWTSLSSGGFFTWGGTLLEDTNGEILVVDPGSYPTPGNGRIFRVDRSTGAQSVVVGGAGTRLLYSIFVDGSGTLYAGDAGLGDSQALGEIYRVDRASGTLTRVTFGGMVRTVHSITGATEVVDNTAPIITAPADIAAEATGPTGAAVSFSATATDDIDGPVPVTAVPPSGSVFPLGTTAVGLAASDAAGNTATAEFDVTVRDTTAPALTLPANQVLEATSASGAVATFAASATDAVGVVSLTTSSASGSTFPIGITTVTVTATDAAGNSSSGSFTVTVRDTAAPAFLSLTASPQSLWPPNHKMVAVRLTALAGDTVGISSLKIVSATSSEPDNGLGDGDTAGDIQVTGDLTLNLRAERSGTGSGRIYTVTVEARDAAGNASTKSVYITVPRNK